MPKKTINLRLILVCIAAVSVSLPIALISLAKLMLLIFAAITLLADRNEPQPKAGNILSRLYTPMTVLSVLFVFALSLLWTVAALPEALSSLGKYGKLLIIVVLIAMIRTRREAIYAMSAFLLAQMFLMASSTMLFFHLPVPWAMSSMAIEQNAVFSSYLDQGIMFATVSAVFWHLRNEMPGRFGKPIAIAFALLALFNVFFVLNARSGHVIAIVLASLAIMWALPKRYRISAVLVPFVLVAAVSFSSKKVHDRISQAQTEIQSFSFEKGANIAFGAASSSSGIRLHFWHRATRSILDHPLAGSGVGSWAEEYNRLQLQQNPQYNEPLRGGNPHQEYLLWGVQLGIPGMVMIVALLLSILSDTMRMHRPYARAAQSVLLALAVSCFFNATIYDALVGDFFCVLIGILLALGLNLGTTPAKAQIQPEHAT